MFRSFGLVLLSAFMLSFSAQAQQPAVIGPTFVLSVQRMCCAKESVPTIQAISKIPGVKRVTCDYKTKNVTIEHNGVSLSPLIIWEAAEKLNIVPVQLATPNGVYKAKPSA